MLHESIYWKPVLYEHTTQRDNAIWERIMMVTDQVMPGGDHQLLFLLTNLLAAVVFFLQNTTRQTIHNAAEQQQHGESMMSVTLP